MEGNKDEALRCIAIAEKYIKENNRDKAEKFLQKAEKLFPTKKAQDLLSRTKVMSANVETEQPRKRKVSVKVEEVSKEPEYTTEQHEAVLRIKKCKDYYEILNITKDATDTEIKKSYKKLALQMHPDKNKAPGSAEAFKAVGNAVAVLTDPEKRKQYDLYGNEEVTRGHSHTSYSRGFESDATAEELFNMFFGSGFNGSNVYVRRGGRWQRQTTGSQRGQHAAEEQQNSYSALLQLLPIIIAILLSVASGLFVSDPAYSLSASNKYPVMRRTQNLQVPYYVKENFHTEFQGSVKRLEMSVEEEFVSNLRHACYREKNYKESMMWKARNFGDHDMFRNAQNMKTPACDQLHQFQRGRVS